MTKNNNKQYTIDTEPGHKVGDTDLALRALDVLKSNFPGYLWRVHINDEPSGGIMNIFNLTVNARLFSNNSYGYVLKLSTVYQDPNLKCVRDAGGEILERANLVRGWYNGDIPVYVDGIPLKNQPLETQQKVVMERLKALSVQQENVIVLADHPKIKTKVTSNATDSTETGNEG